MTVVSAEVKNVTDASPSVSVGSPSTENPALEASQPAVSVETAQNGPPPDDQARETSTQLPADAPPPESISAELLQNATSPAELHERLEKAYELLQQRRQAATADRRLREFARALVTDGSLRNTANRSLRGIVACCHAQLLRIFAPEAPYSTPQLRAVFEVFIRQLQAVGDGDNTTRKRARELLEQLSLLRVFVIMADDEELIQRLFNTLFEALTHDVSTAVSAELESHTLTIMSSVLDETEQPIKPWLLECILRPLVDKSRPSPATATATAAAPRRAAAAAIELLRRCRTQLHTPLSNYLNALLTRDTSVVAGSELLESLDSLITALNAVSPDFLLYVLPNLEKELTAGGAVARARALHTVAQVLSSESMSTVDYFPPLFQAFLRRFLDADADVRAEACAGAEKMLGRGRLSFSSSSRVDELVSALDARLLDMDERVRNVAVAALYANEDVVSDRSVLRNAAARCMDTSPRTRRRAVECVVRSLEGHIRERQPLLAVKRDQPVPALLDASHSWMPPALLRAWRTLQPLHDQRSLHSLEVGLCDGIVVDSIEPPSDAAMTDFERSEYAANIRAVAYVRLFQNLDASRKDCFKDMLAARARTRRAFIALLESATGEPGVKGETSETTDEVVTRAATALAALLPTADDEPHEAKDAPSKPLSTYVTAAVLSRRLCDLGGRTGADARLQRNILTACDSRASWSDAALAGAAAVEALRDGSTHGNELAELLEEVLLPRCRAGIFCADSFSALARIPTERRRPRPKEQKGEENENSAADDDEEENFTSLSEACAWFLSAAAPAYPEAFAGVGEAVTSMLIAEPSAEKDIPPQMNSSEEANEKLARVSTRELALKILSSTGELLKLEREPQERLWNALIPLASGSALEASSTAVEMRTCAKWATRALIRTCQSQPDDAEMWMRLLSALHESVARAGEATELFFSLTAPLMTYSQLAKQRPGVYRKTALAAQTVALKLLTNEFDERAKLSVTDLEPGSATTRSVSFGECVACAVKLLSNAVRASQLSAADGAESAASRDESRAFAESVLRVLVAIIRRNGDVFDVCSGQEDLAHESATCASSRLAAAVGVLKICRVLGANAFNIFSPADFMAVALTAQDANPDVRLSFAKKIYRSILYKRLPFRWVVSLVLMAIDPDRDNLDAVKKFTATLVRTWRKKVSDLREQQRQKEALTPDEELRVVLPMLPESSLPSVVWMLAHHPDAVLDAEANFAETRRYLEFFFGRLLVHSEYAAFLAQILETIMVSEDATEAPSPNRTSAEGGSGGTALLRAVASLSLSILNDMQQSGRRKWELTQYPGKLYLPTEMYRTATDTQTLRRAARLVDRAEDAAAAGAVATDAPTTATTASSGRSAARDHERAATATVSPSRPTNRAQRAARRNQAPAEREEEVPRRDGLRNRRARALPEESRATRKEEADGGKENAGENLGEQKEVKEGTDRASRGESHSGRRNSRAERERKVPVDSKTGAAGGKRKSGASQGAESTGSLPSHVTKRPRKRSDEEPKEMEPTTPQVVPKIQEANPRSPDVADEVGRQSESPTDGRRSSRTRRTPRRFNT